MTDEITEKRRRKNREIVRAWRFAHTKERDEKRARENFERSAEGKLSRHWQQAFSKLTLDQQADIQRQHERAADLLHRMVWTISDISDGKAQSSPTTLYAELKTFLAECPPIQHWLTRATAAQLGPDDLAACDDRLFADYGMDSRIPDFLWEEYKRWTLIWCQQNPELADPEVFAELRATVISNFPPPAPASYSRGLRQLSRAQESAVQVEKGIVEHKCQIQARRPV